MRNEIDIDSHPEGCRLAVWVVPGATRNEIVGPHGGALRVRVTAPPEAGRANAAVAALLEEALGAADVYLDRGLRSRRKRFVVAGLDPHELRQRLLQYPS